MNIMKFFSFEKDLSGIMELLWAAFHAFCWTLDKARKKSLDF